MTHQYADDCQLHLSYDTHMTDQVIFQINAYIDIRGYSTENGLKLNVVKSAVLNLTPRKVVQALGFVLGGEGLAMCNG